MRKAFIRSASSVALVAASAILGTARAEDAADASPNSGDEIIVTGSRLAKPEGASTSPFVAVGQADLTLSGANTVEDLLATLPQFTGGQTARSNNPGTGAATLNLRGLGATRNLVLVNGRRYVFFNETQTTDLNVIPTALVKRVEIVTGGSSAVYGSDAIAGVTNFILEDNFEGVDLRVQGRGNAALDATTTSIDFTVGHNFGSRLNTTLSLDYFDRGAISQGDRPFSRVTLADGVDANGRPALAPSGSLSTPGGDFSNIPSGTALNAPALAGLRNALAAAGLSGLTASGFTFDPGSSTPRPFVDPADRYNFAPLNNLQVPAQRYGLTLLTNYQLTDNLKFHSEISAYRTKTDIQIAEANISAIFPINIDNPFVSPELREVFRQLDLTETGAAQNDGFANIRIARRFSEFGPRQALSRATALRFGGGVSGGLGDVSTAFLRNVSLDAYYYYSRTKNDFELNGLVSRSLFTAGLDRAAPGVDPVVNPFGVNTISPEAVAALSIDTVNPSSSRLHNASIAFTSDVVRLPAGELSGSLGFEYRGASASNTPAPALASGDGIGFSAFAPTSGKLNSTEFFGEARAPLLANLPFAESLSVNGGFRYSHYNLSGAKRVWTYLYGAEWSPIPDIVFRGQFQRAVRAPNIGELFGGQSQDRPRATDPCAQAAALTNATVNALCIATGVPAAAVGLAALQPEARIDGITGGNPDLAPERSNTKTFGATFTPRFAPNFKFTIDRFDITVTGAIAPLAGGIDSILNLCYNVIQDVNSAVCQAVHRNPADGVIAAPFVVNEFNSNIGALATKGVDFGLDYSIPLGRGPFDGENRLSFSSLATWTQSFDITPLQDLPAQVNHCVGAFGATCLDTRPAYKTESRLTWRTGPLTLSLRHRFLSETTDDRILIPQRNGLPGPTEASLAAPHLGAKNYLDFAVTYDLFNQAVSLYGGVNNFINTKPPVVGSSQQQANSYPSTYDALGPEFFVGARARF